MVRDQLPGIQRGVVVVEPAQPLRESPAQGLEEFLEPDAGGTDGQPFGRQPFQGPVDVGVRGVEVRNWSVMVGLDAAREEGRVTGMARWAAAGMGIGWISSAKGQQGRGSQARRA